MSIKMDNQDLVSIITPTYNCGRFISETINSVIAQTYTNWEMIIYDDCSTDNTRDVVDSFIDSRIRYFCNEHNCGAAITRNNALREAKGRWIAFLDSDDMWVNTKLEKQVSFMMNNDYSFSYTNLHYIDEDNTEVGIFQSGPRKVTALSMNNFCWICCSTVMYDADRVGLLQISDVRHSNDYAMWLKICKKANCFLLNEDFTSYRVRKGSLSRNKISYIKHLYVLHRKVEGQGVVCSIINTVRNLFFWVIKKIIYVKSY